MKILGSLQYHRYHILFAANADETDFNVTTKEHEQITVLYSGTVLGEARRYFQTAVHDAMYRTSRSDVDCFMQTGR